MGVEIWNMIAREVLWEGEQRPEEAGFGSLFVGWAQ